MSGYHYCAHVCCFAIIVGAPGDLCDSCAAEDPSLAGPGSVCAGCDNDSEVQ